MKKECLTVKRKTDQIEILIKTLNRLIEGEDPFGLLDNGNILTNELLKNLFFFIIKTKT